MTKANPPSDQEDDMTRNILPNDWVNIGNGFAACIKQGEGWEVWVVDADGKDFRSAWNLASEADAALNLTKVVISTYGDEQIYTTDGIKDAGR